MIVLVTGTDTGVGKTLVASVLAKAVANAGKSVRVRKPVETGCSRNSDASLHPSDGMLLKNAAASTESIEEIVPYRFEPAVAPVVAAEMSGTKISVERIVDNIKEAEQQSDIVIVEGAGGLMVPIAENYTFADLAKDLGVPLLVVCGSKLGAINHTALTLESLKHRGLPVLGYVVNELSRPEEDVSIEGNREQLQNLGRAYGFEELGNVTYLADTSGLDFENFPTSLELISSRFLDICGI